MQCVTLRLWEHDEHGEFKRITFRQADEKISFYKTANITDYNFLCSSVYKHFIFSSPFLGDASAFVEEETSRRIPREKRRSDVKSTQSRAWDNKCARACVCVWLCTEGGISQDEGWRRACVIVQHNNMYVYTKQSFRDAVVMPRRRRDDDIRPRLRGEISSCRRAYVSLKRWINIKTNWISRATSSTSRARRPRSHTTHTARVCVSSGRITFSRSRPRVNTSISPTNRVHRSRRRLDPSSTTSES